jgi:hypothetical protein
MQGAAHATIQAPRHHVHQQQYSIDLAAVQDQTNMPGTQIVPDMTPGSSYYKTIYIQDPKGQQQQRASVGTEDSHQQ